MKSYHLRRREKEITDIDEMRAIVSSARFAAVALCREGEPYIVTMNHGWDAGSDTLYFHCAHEGKKIDFINANQRACATVVEDHGYKHGECDHAYRSVVMNGRIEVVERPRREKTRAQGAARAPGKGARSDKKTNTSR